MLQAQHWESSLLRMAQEALENEPSPRVHAHQDWGELAQAYRQCEAVTRANSKTFSMAAALLPEAKRRATHALYAFCRVSDDFVDHPEGGPQGGPERVPQGVQQVAPNEGGNPQALATRLEAWRRQVVHEAPPANDHALERQVALAWMDARKSFQVPWRYADQLIDGLALDLHSSRYDTFADLTRYCYGVACTVGLMSMHITGYASREAIPYAIRLGVALQLTNILRDVGEDWRAGRLYLPREELADFGLDEDDIAAGVEEGRYDWRWREFMRFQIQRARSLYQEALPGVALLHPDGRFAIAAAGELYGAILNKIEANDYEVFRTRASVGAWGKLRRLPGIWLRASMAGSAGG
jgi:phytoene synthase